MIRFPILLCAVALLSLGACSREPDGVVSPASVGDAARGQATILTASCGACHVIPGVPQANGMVGPPLTGFARRTVVAGMLPNTPANLVLWIRFPQSVVPGNAMPNTGLSQGQARDVAAYLYTLH